MDVTMPETGSPDGAMVTSWLRLPGDRVEAGDGLCLVAWDGNVAELESPESGVLRMLAVEVGRTVPAGTTLARIEAPTPVLRPLSVEPEPQPAPTRDPEPAVDLEPVPEPEPELDSEPEPEPVVELEPDPEPELMPEPEAERAAAVPEALSRDAPVAPAAALELEGFLSPAVRRFVVAHEVDPGRIEGSGRGGRVTLADVRAVVDRATPK
jgi:pyruvate dehydrogenase E2 component (dihydrolipoamide acetyltransferase)